MKIYKIDDLSAQERHDNLVRQKLQGHGVAPPADAWSAVQGGINMPRKRRAILWLPLALLAVLGTGGYWAFESYSLGENSSTYTNSASQSPYDLLSSEKTEDPMTPAENNLTAFGDNFSVSIDEQNSDVLGSSASRASENSLRNQGRSGQIQGSEGANSKTTFAQGNSAGNSTLPINNNGLIESLNTLNGQTSSQNSANDNLSNGEPSLENSESENIAAADESKSISDTAIAESMEKKDKSKPSMAKQMRPGWSWGFEVSSGISSRKLSQFQSTTEEVSHLNDFERSSMAWRVAVTGNYYLRHQWSSQFSLGLNRRSFMTDGRVNQYYGDSLVTQSNYRGQRVNFFESSAGGYTLAADPQSEAWTQIEAGNYTVRHDFYTFQASAGLRYGLKLGNRPAFVSGVLMPGWTVSSSSKLKASESGSLQGMETMYKGKSKDVNLSYSLRAGMLFPVSTNAIMEVGPEFNYSQTTLFNGVNYETHPYSILFNVAIHRRW